MSAFVGTWSLDGSKIDGRVLRRLTAALAYAAPDGGAVWLSGEIGLGFSHLACRGSRGPRRPGRPPMPFGTASGLRLVADCDLYDRAPVLRELEQAGTSLSADASDVEIIASAYGAWGTDCVEHLRGEFAFALWDGHRRRLLLARDRFGLRPLYYVRSPARLAFGNSLDVLRATGLSSSRLDEGAIGDFLWIGYNTEVTGTIFADVRCVPPAHVVAATAEQWACHRYWDLPVDGAVRLPSVEAYAHEFVERLQAAVADRIQGADGVGILLSGGRDSTAIAAMARSVADRPGGPRLHAVTATYDYAIRDDERRYATVAASALDIPVEFLPQDEYSWYERWDREELWRPEPCASPDLAAEVDLHARVATHGRVALTGDGGDAALRETESRLARLLLAGRWTRLASEAARYIGLHRRLPRPGVRRLRQRRKGLLTSYPPVPRWIRPEFVAAARLSDRWDALIADDTRQWTRHSTRPEAFTKLRSVFWSRDFEEQHATATGQRLSIRHPFFDERVVEFLLALPAEQWLNDKGIVLAAMRTRLPAPVAYRKKTPLAGDSDAVLFRHGGRRPVRGDFDARVLEYVDPDLLFTAAPGASPFEAWDWVRAYSFSRWLGRLSTGRRFSIDEEAVSLEADPQLV